MTTLSADYPLFVNHALELTDEITSRLAEIASSIENVVEIHPGDEVDGCDEGAGVRDTYDLLCGALSDFTDELRCYLALDDDDDDECDCESSRDDLTDCVAKILEGHRLGYLSIPEGLAAEMEEALNNSTLAVD